MALKKIVIVEGPSKFDLMLALFDPYPCESMARGYLERELIFRVKDPRRQKVKLRALILGIANKQPVFAETPSIWTIQAQIRDEDLALALGLNSDIDLPKGVRETPLFTAIYNSRTKKGELQIELPEDDS